MDQQPTIKEKSPLLTNEVKILQVNQNGEKNLPAYSPLLYSGEQSN